MSIRSSLPNIGVYPFSNIRFVIGTGKTKDGRDIHPSVLEESLLAIRKQLAQIFGGYTETRGCGGWYDADRGVLVEETNVIFDVAITADIEVGFFVYERAVAGAQDVVDHASRILEQACILVQFGYGQSIIVYS